MACSLLQGWENHCKADSQTKPWDKKYCIISKKYVHVGVDMEIRYRPLRHQNTQVTHNAYTTHYTPIKTKSNTQHSKIFSVLCSDEVTHVVLCGDGDTHLVQYISQLYRPGRVHGSNTKKYSLSCHTYTNTNGKWSTLGGIRLASEKIQL
jgi:hypothetical protein